MVNAKNIFHKNLNLLIFASLFLLAFLLCMLSPMSPFGYTGLTNTDSSVYKYIGWMMAEGHVPYRDFFEHKGFLLYFFNYIGVALSYNYGVWFVELVLLFIAITFIYLLARKFNNRIYSLFVTILTITPMYLYFSGGNLSEEYALPFEIVALFIFFDYFMKPEKYERSHSSKILSYLNFNVIVCGCCFSCVFFIRANMCSLWVIFCIMVLIQCIHKKQFQALGKFIVSFIVGMLIISLPIFIYLAAHGALNNFFSDYLYFSKLYISHETRASSLNKVRAFFTFLNNTSVLLTFVIIFASIIHKVRNKQNAFFDCGYVAYMILNLIFICISGQTFMHYGMTLIPMYIYPYSIMCRYLSSDKQRELKINVLVVAYLAVTLLLPDWINLCENATVKVLSGASPYTDSAIEYIKANTSPEDRISVFGNKSIIYNLSQRKSASRYSYQAPIGTIVNPDIMDEYFEELQETLPPIIVWQTDRISSGPDADRMHAFLEQNEYVLIIDDTLALYERTNLK